MTAEEKVKANWPSATLQSHKPVPPIFDRTWFIWNFGVDGPYLLSCDEHETPADAWEYAAKHIDWTGVRMEDKMTMNETNEAACAVCGRVVAAHYQSDHLQSWHLGPHYFWMDGKRFRTMEPSMTGAEIKAFTNSPNYHMYKQEPWREDKQFHTTDTADFISDGMSVSLVGEPHFYCVPPAMI